MDTAQAAFLAAAPGVRLSKANLSYGYANKQILTFVGWYADNRPFAYISAPFDGDPTLRAEAIAQELVATHKRETMKLPNLASIPTELDKLRTILEDDSRKYLDRITGMHNKRQATFAKANTRLDGVDTSLGQVDTFLDAIDAATNGGPPATPTSGGS